MPIGISVRLWAGLGVWGRFLVPGRDFAVPLWGMSFSLSSQLLCWMGCSTLALLVLQQLPQPQQSILCGDKSPPHISKEHSCAS